MLHIQSIVAFCCISFVLRVHSKTPSEQPGCRYNTKADDFYRAWAPSKKDDDEPKTNWVCRQTFRSKLKVCTGMYRLMVNRKFETSYELKNEKDKLTVKTECEKQNVTFYRHGVKKNATEDFVDEAGLITLQVDMFRCPISKMDYKFKFWWKIFKPKQYDFYVTQGYGPSTVALLNDSPGKDNICVSNMFRPKSAS